MMTHERICECGKRISVKCDEEKRHRDKVDELTATVRRLLATVESAYQILYDELY